MFAVFMENSTTIAAPKSAATVAKDNAWSKPLPASVITYLGETKLIGTLKIEVPPAEAVHLLAAEIHKDLKSLRTETELRDDAIALDFVQRLYTAIKKDPLPLVSEDGIWRCMLAAVGGEKFNARRPPHAKHHPLDDKIRELARQDGFAIDFTPAIMGDNYSISLGTYVEVRLNNRVTTPSRLCKE